MKYIYLKFGSEFVKKASVTLFFRDIISYLEGKFIKKNSSYTDYKFLVYSAHDRNVFLILLNLLTPQEFAKLGEEGNF
jgi:hypothetical protein